MPNWNLKSLIFSTAGCHTFSDVTKLFFIRKLTLYGVWLRFHYCDIIFLIMFANPQKRKRTLGRKRKDRKTGQFLILLLEAKYNRDFLIGLLVCFALVRNFLPKLINLNFKLKDLVLRKTRCRLKSTLPCRAKRSDLHETCIKAGRSV